MVSATFFRFKTAVQFYYDITDESSLDPFVVAVWFGDSKPSCVNEYLTKFVQELNGLAEHGMEINGFQLSVRIRSIIADTPARSFLKGEYFSADYKC